MRTQARLVLLSVGLSSGLMACVQDVVLRPEATPPPPDADVSPPPPAPTGNPDGGGRRDAAAASSCEQIFDFRQENPQVILALDRSASMWQKYGASLLTRLEETQGALKALMTTFHESVHMGYVEFPVSDCAPGATAGCCASPVISPGRDSLDPIQRRWGCVAQAATCSETGADAPSYAALRGIRNRFADLDQPISSRHVFLMMDGEPACGSRASECSQSITEVALLWGNESVETDVFVLAEEAQNNSCLQSIAGVRLDSNGPSPYYHVAPTAAVLLEQLEEKVAALSRKACTFRLSSALRPPDSLVLSFGDGSTNTVVPHDPLRSNGWEFEPDSVRRFTVYGPLCEALKTSQIADVDVEICTPDRGNSRRP